MIEKQVKKIDYRLRRIYQPNDLEREELKARLYKFTSQAKAAKQFRTSVQNVVNAFRGNNAGLMNKLKNYIENYETRNGAE